MKKKSFNILLISLLIFSFIFNACQSGPDAKEKEERKRRNLHIYEEYLIGRASAAIVVDKYGLIDNDTALNYFTAIGSTLALASQRISTFHGYTFGILNTDEVLSYAFPDGYIFVSKGLIKKLTSEDQLAGILAVEISHIVYNDPINAIRKDILAELYTIFNPEEEKGVDKEEVNRIFNIIVDEVITILDNGYSLEAVKKSDKNAVTILNNAGYASQALNDALQSLSDHGLYKSYDTSERISLIDETIAALPENHDILEARTTRFTEIMSEL